MQEDRLSVGSNTALEGPMRNCSVWWWLATHTVICTPLSYLTSTHDKPWIVTKDNLSQVLTSVVTTAADVIHWLRTCCLLVPWMRLRIGQRPSSFFRPVYQAQKRQFASSSPVHQYAFAIPLWDVWTLKSHVRSELTKILRVFLSTRYHTVQCAGGLCW